MPLKPPLLLLLLLLLPLLHCGNLTDLLSLSKTFNYNQSVRIPRFSPDSKFFTIINEHRLLLYSTETQSEVQVIENQANATWVYVEFSPDSKWMYLAVGYNEIQVFKEEKGLYAKVRTQIIADLDNIGLMRATWDNEFLIIGAYKRLAVYHQSNLSLYKTLHKTIYPLNIQLFHHFKSFLVFGKQTSMLLPTAVMYNYSESTFDLVRTAILPANSANIQPGMSNYHATLMAQFPLNKTVSIYDRTWKTEVARLNGHEKQADGYPIWTGNDHYVVTGGRDKKIIVWSAKTFLEVYRTEATIELHNFRISCDSKYIFFSGNQSAELWKVNNPELFGNCNSINQNNVDNGGKQSNNSWLLLNVLCLFGILAELLLNSRSESTVITLIQGFAFIGWSSTYTQSLAESIQFANNFKFSYLHFGQESNTFGILDNAYLCLFVYIIGRLSHVIMLITRTYLRRNNLKMVRVQYFLMALCRALTYPLIFFALTNTVQLSYLNPITYSDQIKGGFAFFFLLIPSAVSIFAHDISKIVLVTIRAVFMYLSSIKILTSMPRLQVATSWFCLLYSMYVLMGLFVSIFLVDKRRKSKYSTLVMIAQGLLEIIAVIAFYYRMVSMTSLFLLLSFAASVMSKFMLKRVERARNPHKNDQIPMDSSAIVQQQSAMEMPQIPH